MDNWEHIAVWKDGRNNKLSVGYLQKFSDKNGKTL